MKAYQGLPKQTLDKETPIFGIVSRYHISETTSSYTYFFKCSTESEMKEWLKTFHINYQWSLRFSAMFYPRGSAKVVCDNDNLDLSTQPLKDTYIRNARLHNQVKKKKKIF